MSFQPIQSFCIPSDEMVLTTDAFMYIKIGGFEGWSFDVNLLSTAASGDLKFYLQNDFPIDPDQLVSLPLYTIPVSAGTFPSGETRYTFDNNNGTNEPYMVLRWTGTDSSNGTVTINGVINTF